MKYMPALAAAAVGSQPSLESLDPSLEGFKDALLSPIKTLKARFTTNDEAKLRAQIDEKIAVLKNEHHNLEKMRSALASSKDKKGVYMVSLKRNHNKYHFSASNPEQLVAGLNATVKFMDGVSRDAAKIKTKSEGQAVEDRVKAEFAKIGKVPDAMLFNHNQAMAYLTASLRIADSMMHYLEVIKDQVGQTVSNEGIGDAAVTILKIIVSVLFIVIWSRLVAVAIILIASAAFVVNPFLGVVVGLGLFGAAIHVAGHIGEALGKWIAGEDEEHASHLLAKNR